MAAWAGLLLILGLTVSGLGHASIPQPDPGIAVAISPSPQLDFGSQPLGSQSQARTVTLSIVQAPLILAPIVNIFEIASSESDFRIFNNNCTQLGGEAGPTSCTFDASFRPSRLGELLADLNIDCQAVSSDGATIITCRQTRGIETIANYFRGIASTINVPPGSGEPVPTLSQWGITLASLALLGVAVRRLKKR